ncbi:MAG: hypothetical protein VKJ06_09480 [Vampirovibrionales bacterium]|nr:hypothetical protein [Vampirovibrionales bacterium]
MVRRHALKTQDDSEHYAFEPNLWRRHKKARAGALLPKGQRRWRMAGEGQLNAMLLEYHRNTTASSANSVL